MKKIKVFIILFLFLFMILFIDTGIAQTDYFMISDNSDLVYGSHITDNNICVDTNGYYYIFVWNDTTPYNFTLLKSVDSGDSWVESVEFDMSDDYNMQPDGLSTYIDDFDVIHLAYHYGDGSGYNVSYRNYNTIFDTVSIKTHIKSQSVNKVCYGISILKNDDKEICLAWSESYNPGATDVGTLYCKVYNDQVGEWGDLKTIATDSNSIIYYYGLAGDVLSNGTFVFSLMRHRSTDNRFRVYWFDDETDGSGFYLSVTPETHSTSCDRTDVAVDGNDDIHCVWETRTTKINYTSYDIGMDALLNESLAEDTASSKPQISISTDDEIHIVFQGDNGVTPSDYIFGYYGSFGSWSDLQYYVSGSTDDNVYPKIPYQNLQSFTHLTDGVIGYYYNSSDSNFIHFDEGYELFYGADGNGTSEQGFPQCEASGWIIEKQFADSIGYYNDTLAFVIKRTTPLFGLYAIMNSTFDVVQTGSFYGATYPTWYFVDPQYGTGTYYIVAGYNWDVWAINCTFTIVSEGSVSDLWILESTKPTFNVGEDVILRYVIPEGQYGNITVTEDGDPLETLTIADIMGTGGYETISFGVSQVGDLCYHAYLRNASNNVLRASTPQFCIGESFFDYDIFVDGEKEVTVTAKDTVSISGYVQGISSEVHIFMVYDNITRYSWAVGDATNKILFARNWRIDYNYTLGDEVYYLYLGTSYGLFEDKFVTVTVSDYVGEPTPFDDGSWYGLPFWVPYLIGVFLTLFVTMSPLIIGTYITRNSRIEKINIPPLLYVGFFYFGLIISVVIGFLPSWLPFVILFAMIVYFAVTWLAGKQASVQGE